MNMRRTALFFRLRTTNRLLAIVGLIGGVCFERYAMRASGQFPFDAFALWVGAPFLVMLVPIAIAQTVKEQIALLLVSVVLVAGGLYCYWDTMFVHIDAQGALVFLFIPLYQLAVVLAVLCVAVFIRAIAARAARGDRKAGAEQSPAA